jgi:hypothetical protein
MLGPVGMKSGVESFQVLSNVISNISSIASIFNKTESGGINWDVVLAGTQDFSKNSVTMLQNISSGIPLLGTEFTNLDKNIKDLKTGHIEIVAASLTGMIKSINDTKTNLAVLLSNPLDINATLGKVVDKLGIKDKSEFTIKHNDVNINVKLNMKVEAKEFLKVLLETDQGKELLKNR